MKYYYLILVAWSLYWMGAQSQGCDVTVLSFPQLCSDSPWGIVFFPSLTTCSKYYNCYASEMQSCGSGTPYYNLNTISCSTDPSQCVNGDPDAFTNTCANNENKTYPVTMNGTTMFWVICGPNGPEPEICDFWIFR